MKAIVGVFDNDQDAEQALNALDQHGFGREHVEMVATDVFNEDQPAGVDRDAASDKGDRDGDDVGALPLTGIAPGVVPGNVTGVGGVQSGSVAGAGTMGYIPVALGRLNSIASRLRDMGIDRDDAEFYARAAQKNAGNAILVVVKAGKDRVDEVIQLMRDANGKTPEHSSHHD
jgi:hypothetical protein